MYEAIDRVVVILLILGVLNATLGDKVANFLQMMGCSFLHHQFDYKYEDNDRVLVICLCIVDVTGFFSHLKRLICLFYFWFVAFSLL